jgi:ATP adenylyltransferase
MERIFAPWRLKFVSKGVRLKGCLFCGMMKKGDDASRFILERGRHAFLVLNKFPYTSGHSMVAVNRHKGTVSALTEAERSDVWRLVSRAERAIGKVYKPEGMNLGINVGHCAGAGVVGHLHVHLVPRWYGDTNFMTAVDETRVLPEDLGGTYARLSQALAKLRG